MRASAASVLAEASWLEEFLDSLDMEASVELVDDDNLSGVAQLVGKTNQFNLTSRRRTPLELQQLLADPAVLGLVARLKDRFADHGLVAVVLARQDGSTLDLDTWLMSCRVIGRSLEHAQLDVLDHQARRRGCTTVRGAYMPTTKNGLVADLYARLGFQADGAGADGTTLWTRTAGAPVPRAHIRVDDTALRRD